MGTAQAQFATENDQLIAALERSERCWLAMLDSVPESAAGMKLREECWSILQIAEHVATVEHRMLRAMEGAAEKTSAPNVELDCKIVVDMTNREAKRQAPELVIPKGRWFSLGECAEAFRKSRSKAIEFVRSAKNLRGRSVTHPLLGEIDGHQVILVMAGHPERHALQIEEIKASAAYQAAVGY